MIDKSVDLDLKLLKKSLTLSFITEHDIQRENNMEAGNIGLTIPRNYFGNEIFLLSSLL